MKLPKSKEALILTAALVIPGGFVALGLWKAYELYKKREEHDTSRQEDQPAVTFQSAISSFDDRLESDRLPSGERKDQGV